MAEILLIQQELECLYPPPTSMCSGFAFQCLPSALLSFLYETFTVPGRRGRGVELVLILLPQSIQPLLGPINPSLPLAAFPRERVHF